MKRSPPGFVQTVQRQARWIQDFANTLTRDVRSDPEPQPPARPTPPKSSPPKALLSFREAAKRLGVDRASLPALVASGQLRVVQVNGRARVPLAELERLVQEGFDVSSPAPRGRRKPRVARLSPATEAERIRKLKF